MSAKLVYSSTKFTITITNETTGKTFSKTSAVSGAKRIVGRMDCRGSFER